MEWIILTGLILGISGVIYAWGNVKRIHLDNDRIYLEELLKMMSTELDRKEESHGS